MKKILVVLFVGLLFLSGCSKKEESVGKLSFITLTEYKTKLESKDDYVVVIGNVDCSACQQFKPVLEEINKNKNSEIFYVQIDNSKWSANEKSELLTVTKDAFGFDVAGTPTTFIVKNGELEETVVGYKDYSVMIDLLVDNGIIAQ